MHSHMHAHMHIRTHYCYKPYCIVTLCVVLQNLIAMKASQFTGFAQHDAQEFMAFLLDGLHEVGPVD